MPPREWKDRLLSWLELDVRSLALFRIVIGSTLLVDLICDLGDAEGLYTSAGALPRTLWAQLYEHSVLWCIHTLGDSLFFVRGMLLLQLALAGMLLVGYRTRFATVASWIFFVSLLNRNIYATDGGDQIACFLLFTAMFLPLGACWSVDSWRDSQALEATTVRGLGSVLLILQMMLLYSFAGMAKLCERVWWTGEAMDVVLRWSEFAKPLAEVLRQSPAVTRLVTHVTPWLEIFAPFFFVVAGPRQRLRGLAVLLFAGMHLGIDLTLRLSFFSAYSWAGLAALVPSGFWSLFSERGKAAAAYSIPVSGWERWLRRGAILVALCSAYSALPALLGEERVPYPMVMQYVNDFDYGYQNWNLFRDPNPTPGWLRAKATLRNGKVVDLLDGGAPFSEARPRLPSDQYPSRRWLSFLMHAPQDWGIPALRGNFARFAATHWNDSHSPDERVRSLVVVYYREQNPPFRPTTPLAPYDYALYEEGSDPEQP